MKQFLIDFFHFNKQERNGVYVLCCIIFVLAIIRFSIPYLNTDTNQVQLFDIKDSLLSAESPSFLNESDKSPEEITENSDLNSRASELIQYKVFNPNTITENEALTLGFSKKLAKTLINYRNKGGKFYKSSDLKKLYGMSIELYSELEKYIQIPTTKFESSTNSNYEKSVYENKPKSTRVVEINAADSLSLVYLKGIGPSFAKRIIKYRTLLGGFYSMNQLHEVYGMTDSLYVLLCSQITLDAQSISKISINTIDFQTLRKHPYFNYQIAQATINYRTKHGKLFEADLVNIGVFSEEKLKQIKPYLSYE